jgi:23S rRNA pseudouridine1911/1915/1917 synthase
MNPSSIVVRIRESVRLDRYLTGRLAHVSRNRIQRHIEQGDVLVNGRRVRSNHKLQGGETLRLPPFEERKLENASRHVDFRIVYEDEDVVVVDKPAGVLVHPIASEFRDTLLNGLHHRLSARGDDASGLGIVHRLDRWTSGLIVVAKRLRARRRLAQDVEKRQVRRHYLGIAGGHPQHAQGSIDLWIRRDPRRPTRMQALDERAAAALEIVRPHVSTAGFSDEHRDARARSALTHYRVLRRLRGAAVFALRLQTGRTHQIRVHLQALGHPLLGDPIYGPPAAESPQVLSSIALERPALHASRLEFAHPSSGQLMRFRARLPEDLRNVLRVLL